MRFAIIVIGCLLCCQNIESASQKNSSCGCDIESKKLRTLFSAKSAGFKIAENTIGVAQTYFYPISSENKNNTSALYNKNSVAEIHVIYKDILSLSKCAKSSAECVARTLTQLTSAINVLIIDSAGNQTESVIEADYLQIDRIVEAFKNEFPGTLHHKNDKNILKAIHLANKSLEAFAQNVKIYIYELNLLVFKSLPANQIYISSQDNLIRNLKEFVAASFVAVYLSTSKG